MAEKLTQFASDQPILEPVDVSSTARGSEALAAAAAEIGIATMKGATSIATELSAVNLLNASVELQDAKYAADINMRKNPDPAMVDQIRKNHVDNVTAIIKSNPVNRGDRKSLTKLANDDLNSVNYTAQTHNIAQYNLRNAMKLATEFPQTLQNIAEKLITDPQAADILMDATNKTIETAVMSGAISSEQGARYFQTLGQVIDRHSRLLNMMGDEHATAADYHAANAFSGNEHDANSPSYENSSSYKMSLNSDTNYQDAIAGLYRGDVNMLAVIDMTDEQYQKFLLTMEGISSAKGNINSGMPHGVIEQRMNYLDKSKSGTLTVAEEGERNMYGKFINDLKDNYIGTMSRTPQGADIVDRFRNRAAAINGEAVSSDEKNEDFQEAYMGMVSEFLNLGKAQGIPDDIIKPVPAQNVATAQNSFALNADTSLALTELMRLNTLQGTFLAASLEDPLQQQTLYAVNLLRDTPSNKLSSLLISANQSGRDYSQLKFGSQGESDVNIRATLASKLSKQMDYITKNGGDASSFLKMATNAVKYMGVTNNDFTLSNMNDYINKLSVGLGSAYNIKSGANYQFNTTEMGNISSGDAAALANYVTGQAYKYLGDGISEEKLVAAIDANPVTISYTPSGNIVARDQFGVARYSEPYTHTLLDAAKARQKKVIKEAKQDIPITVNALGNF